MSNSRTFIIKICFFIIPVFLVCAPLCRADDHKEGKKHFQKKEHGKISETPGKARDKGNETTGQLVAWSLAVANLPVVISLAVRAIRRFAPLQPEVKNYIWKFNSNQKKLLMRFHYVLNPLILAIALLHWSLSKCTSTSLPEWGLFIMSVIVGLGIVLRFKLCPKTMLRRVYSTHTQPALILILTSVLLIGHLSLD